MQYDDNRWGLGNEALATFGLILVLVVIGFVLTPLVGKRIEQGQAMARLEAGAPAADVLHAASKDTSTREAVILLHGLARSSRSMSKMEAALKEEGYLVYSIDYSSRQKTVERLSREDLSPAVIDCQRNHPDKIHFVAHSLGNIVIRHYLSENTLTNMGRIVMLGPPNKGSEVPDKLGHITLYQWINGPAGNQLGTDKNSLPNTLPVPAADIGVIAGTRSINWILSSFIPGTDDGKVSPKNAKIEGMKDFATVPITHPFLMRRQRVIDMTISFLKHGKFEE